ncbi:hypothetical protein D9M71_610670 [compost metagenome]
MVHAHVTHADQGTGIDLRHRGAQTLTHGQGAAGIAGAIHGLGKDGVSLFTGRFNDDVVGFRHGDTELVDAHRLDVLAVSRHHGHFQPRNAHIEVAHG